MSSRLDALRLNLVEALFGRETGEQVDGWALLLLHVLLEILAGLGALPRARGPRDIEYRSLSFVVSGMYWNLLSLASMSCLNSFEQRRPVLLRRCSRSGLIR